MMSRGFGGALYGPQIKYGSTDAQRQQQLAQLLLKEGVNTAPAQGGIGEVLARIGTAGIGGYLSGKAGETEKEYQSERAKTLARALSMGQDQTNLPGPNPDGSAGYNRPADPNAMAQILMGNPSTADMGANLAIGQMTFNRDRAAKKEDTAEERGFRKEMFGLERQGRMEDLYMTQGFQERLAKMQMAQQAGLADEARQHAVALQQMQQQFMGGENEKNRAAQLAQQQATAALAKVPQGYQVSPQGGIAPIPGSPQATEAADLAKSKGESIVSVDRMIRSIDELSTHPGLEGTVGFSVGQRYIPGTDAASFDARLETLKSQAFLPMVAQLKGMGQLSDAEGKKLTAAIGALEPRMSEKEFRASLAEIKGDLEAARKRMGAPDVSTVARPNLPANAPALPPGFQVLP